MVPLISLMPVSMLERHVEDGYVRQQDHPHLPLRIYNYTEKCAFERKWDVVKLAQDHSAEVEVKDFTDVPLEECLKRDAHRWPHADPVGADVINNMHERFLKGKTLPLPVPEIALEGSRVSSVSLERYEPKPGTPTAVIVDIDGTVALHNGRSPYDYTRVVEDLPNRPITNLVQTLVAAGHRIIFVSGRPDSCYEATKQWLEWFVVGKADKLFMRTEGDTRADWIVKTELFDKHIRDDYKVVLVLDDRNQVVDMWRKLGLTCLQVAEGNF